MKFHIRFDAVNLIHSRFTVFVDGANCGRLCMRSDEAERFVSTLAHGATGGDEFSSTVSMAMPADASLDAVGRVLGLERSD